MLRRGVLDSTNSRDYPQNILEIYKVEGQNRTSKYSLKIEKLTKLLEPIKNMEVVVIAVVGQSRRGKSFLLNYMCRYLNDYKNISGWVGDGNRPLELGFGWKSSSDPQTFGLWLSKPFIVKQSNGKEIGVLLMDTQGLFDDLYDQRDWSTIVGISLLVSSCLIVNVFTDISDDILSTLDSYIEYGLKAVETNDGNKENIPFQTLLFLVRDWNTVNEFKFGMNGGKQYLEKKLILRNNQSKQAQNVRKNMKKCFKDILCYLMPSFGDVVENEDFDGSFDQLRGRFKEKLKEFIETILNPEGLVSKTIGDTPITGEELCQQFQNLVEVFNREKMPESQDIIGANAKLFGNIIIRKLKDMHLNNLLTFIQSKPFVTRNELKEKNDIYRTEYVEELEGSLKSNDTKLVDKLEDFIKKNYLMVFKQNEEKRNKFMEEKRDICGQKFMETLNNQLSNAKFVDIKVLEEIFNTLEKKILDSYKQCFGGEEETLFEKDQYELKFFMTNLEKAKRIEILRRNDEFEKEKDEYIGNVAEFYTNNMNQLLKENLFFDEKEFKESETEIRNKTETKFRQIYDFGNKTSNDMFYYKVNLKLKDLRNIYKEQNKGKCHKITVTTNTVIAESIDNYKTDMNDVLHLITSVEDLQKSHQKVLNKIYKEMQNKLPFKAKYFIEKYIEDFKIEINNLLKSFINDINEKKENIHKKYLNAMNEAKDHYIQGMNQTIQENAFFSSNELDRNHRNIRKNALKIYENHFNGSNAEENPLFWSYQSKLNKFIDEEFEKFEKSNDNNQEIEKYVDILIQESINKFNIRMKQLMENTTNEGQLSNNYSLLKEELKNEMLSNIKISDKNFIKDRLPQFEENLSRIYLSFKDELNNKKSLVLTEYDQKVKDCVDQYKHKMDKKVEDVIKSLNVDNLKALHKRIKSEIITELKQLKISFGIDLNTYIEKTKQIIENEFSYYFLNFVKQRYSKELNSLMETTLIEEQLIHRHKELTELILNEFNNGVKVSNRTLRASHQKELQDYMNIEFTKYMSNFKEKTVDSYKTLYLLLSSQYCQEMENIVQSEDNFSDNFFEEMHNILSNENLGLFEKHMKENPCGEGKTYFIQLKNDINTDYNRLRQRFDDKQNMKRKDLKISIKELEEIYQKEMREKVKIVSTKQELKDIHLKIKEKLIEDFKNNHSFRDENQITPYIENIEENIENFYLDYEDLFEVNYEKLQILNQNLKRDIRKFYSDEMMKYFQNNQFIPKAELNRNHRQTLTKTSVRFKSEKPGLDDKSFNKMVEQFIEDILKKIVEDNQLNKETDSPAIGIDLGTTNSCVAYYVPNSRKKENLIVIPNEFGKYTTPSVVSYRDNSNICVGEVAKDEIHSYPRNTISSVKRLIGHNFTHESVQKDLKLWSYKVINVENTPKISVKVDGKDEELFPEQVSAEVLKKMKKIAEDHLNCEVKKAVITVPAYFNDGQKEATKAAGKLAGLEVLRIINEPTAAAIAFKVDRNEETEIRNVLIFDFGGGTFDVSILEINRGKINVKAVDGDNHLGGDDIDTNIINYCLDEFFKEHKEKLEGPQGEGAMCRLRNKCEEHKKKLTSKVDSTNITIDNFYKNIDLNVVLTKQKFEEINNKNFEKSIEVVKRALNQINMSPSDINDVVLVGGTTRIPKIQEMLSEFFGGKALNHWVNPDEAVAKGAAIQAALLNGMELLGAEELELNDVTPLSLGIEILGGTLSVIIPRNTPVPHSAVEQYFPSRNFQTSVQIKIYEGEMKMAKDNHLLGQFTLNGIPPSLSKEQPIDVSFILNDEGILKVKAKLVSTGGENEIEISEHKGRLTEELIEKLLKQTK